MLTLRSAAIAPFVAFFFYPITWMRYGGKTTTALDDIKELDRETSAFNRKSPPRSTRRAPGEDGGKNRRFTREEMFLRSTGHMGPHVGHSHRAGSGSGPKHTLPVRHHPMPRSAPAPAARPGFALDEDEGDRIAELTENPRHCQADALQPVACL